MIIFRSFQVVGFLLLILWGNVLYGACSNILNSNVQLRLTETSLNTEEAVKNFHLSEVDFHQMVAGLKMGDNMLFKQIFLAQAEETIGYLKGKYNAQHDDAYDAFIESLITFRQRILDDKVAYGNLRFLLTRMASQHYLKLIGKQLESPKIDQLENLVDEEDETRYSEEQIKILAKVLLELKDGCRELLKMNYFDGMKLNDISEKLGKSAASVRKQKERCKQTLIELFNKSYNG